MTGFGLDLPEAGQRSGTSKMHQAESFVTWIRKVTGSGIGRASVNLIGSSVFLIFSRRNLGKRQTRFLPHQFQFIIFHKPIIK